MSANLPSGLSGADLVALAMAALAVAGAVQSVLGWVAFRWHLRRCRVAPAAGAWPALSLLKPLHGEEVLLEEALASFCAQEYPAFQIVFGVQSASDKALRVVRRLQARFPQVEMAVVVDPAGHGANHKIGNLINMLPHARHEVLVIADSDMHAAPDYLRRVVSTLAAPGCGLVTTLYAGRADRPTLWNRLGAAHLNQIFAPGVLLARALGRQDCMGATMALTRATLDRVGGLRGLAAFVADDAVLGRRVRALGLSVRLAATIPATTVAEPGSAGLFRHELRWARTIRSVAPIGFALSVLQLPLALALAAVALAPDAAWSWGVLGGIWAIRAATAADIECGLGVALTPLWLLPARDVLSVVVMLGAYAGREVAWRGRVLDMSAAPARGARMLSGDGVPLR